MTARILIVDDVPITTRTMAAKLAAEYYQVSEVHSGQAALDRARDWQPDIILLDVMMPGMDGHETCRRLKASDATMHIPVVMITASGAVGERVRGLEAGADDFLVKPVDFATLFARLKPLVRLKRLLDEWRMRGTTARALGLRGGALEVPSVEGARALVVDDDDITAGAVIEALAADAVVTTRARTAAETTMMLSAMPFDLVVMSLSMHSGDPLRLASELRAADATQAVPLLLIAGPEQRDQLLRGFDLGANDWLLRPLEPNELRARVRNQIRRKFYQERLHADLDTALEMALTDPLTGCYNQRYLNRHLAGLLAARPGQDGAAPVSLMMIDVDHFKAVNDRFGHPEGDRALRAIADTLRGRVRAFDAIARYGGEEFAVVMPGTLPPEALVAAERLRLAIETLDCRAEDGSRLNLTVSIGVAHTGRQPCTADALVRQADAALYAAKRAGRNQVSQAAI